MGFARVALFVAFLSNANAFGSAQEESEELVMGCSSHCSVYTRSSMSCWKKTLAYFDEILLGAMRGYVGVQRNIARWYRDRKTEPLDGDTMVQETVNHLNKIQNGRDDREWALVDSSLFKSVVTPLVDAVMEPDDEEQNIVNGCPRGCERRIGVWLWLCVVCWAYCLLVGLFALYYTYRLERFDTSEALISSEKNTAAATAATS